MSTDPIAKEKLCQNAVFAYFYQSAITYGSSAIITVINIVSCQIFIRISTLEAVQTETSLTYTRFSKIAVMQFLNIAAIIMIINFSVEGMKELKN